VRPPVAEQATPANGAQPPEPQRTSVPGPRSDLVAALRTALLVALVGVPLGAVWALLAPREQVLRTENGAQFAEPGGDLFVTADLVLLVLLLLAGLVCGYLVHARAGHRGWPVIVGLAVGGTAGALVAAELGALLGNGPLVFEGGQVRPADGQPLTGEAGAVFDVALGLRATAVLVAWPLASLMISLLLQLREPTGDRRPPVSSD
jgi:hypothetical protein